MATLYTLSTLNEYTWTALYGKKQIYLSYIAVSKSQAISGLLGLLHQLQNNKSKIVDDQDHIFINLYIGEKEVQYGCNTIVTTLQHKNVTIGDLLLNTEPSVSKFLLGTIREDTT
jgi:hypothetical protein